MFRDARGVSTGDTLDADICIVGAGPAGVTVAMGLANSSTRVLVLESGGMNFDPDLMELSDGENVGLPYYPLFESRARAFGGSSHLWPEEGGLRSRPFDPIDFRQREGIPHSGWPFGHSELEDYYRRAHEVCDLGEPVYEVGHWEDSDAKGLTFGPESQIQTAIFKFGRSIEVFQNYRHDLEVSKNVTVLHHANVVEIVTTENGNDVSHLEVVGLWSSTFRVRARRFVLATGGIENARLLLASRRNHTAGLGNTHDLVGRFFMEHPRVQSGVIAPARPRIASALGLYSRRSVGGQTCIGVLTARENALSRSRILNNAVYLRAVPSEMVSSTYRSAAAIAKAIRTKSLGSADPVSAHLTNVLRHPISTVRGLARRVTGSTSGSVIQMTIQAEQSPNPASRVTLASKKDPLGFPLARLDWQLTELDHESIRGIQRLVDDEFRRNRWGQVVRFYGDEKPPLPIRGHWHHMGTTRMHTDPKRGVTDANGRVHGLSNLYIAGSSLFPTSGFVNPTLTVVALALRLVDHLEGGTWGDKPVEPERLGEQPERR